MGKNINFDFCIIPNPFAEGGKNMIFITKSGENSLDREIASKKDYKEVKEVLEKFGYTETSALQFESSTNPNLPESTIREMKIFLEDCGLSYSRELEVNVVRDLNSLKVEADKIAENNLEFIYGEETPIKEKTKNELIESKSELFKFEHKEPELREKITLHFYLFLEFGFNQFGKPFIQFGGDFKDNEDYDDRNYVKIVESEFVRVNDQNSPNSIVLKSTKTQEDFLAEAGILYSGYFKYQKRIEDGESMILKETKYPYRLVEVKKHLIPDQSIVVETNRMGYDRLIKLSDKIKTEGIQEKDKFIAIGDIEYEAEELTKFLTKKMEILSEVEEFEEASKFKKDIDFIKDKVDYIKSLNRVDISTEEYYELFSIS